MCKKNIFLTAVMTVLSGFSITSMAESFVNIDYSQHAGSDCTNADAEVAGGATVATTGTFILATQTGGAAGGCIPTPATAGSNTATNPPQFYFNKDTGEGATAFITAAADTRISNTGVIHIPETAGKTFAIEILQTGTWTIPSGEGDDDGTPLYAGVMYRTDGWIGQNFKVAFTLDGATFDGEPLLAIANSDYQEGGTGITTGYLVYDGFFRQAKADGQPEVAFTVRPGESGTLGVTQSDKDGDGTFESDGTINHQSIFLLLYRIQDATALQTENGEVTMTASLVAPSFTGGTPTVNRTLTRTIATSVSSLSASISSEDEGIIYISVDDNSKSFTDKSDNSTTDPAIPDAFRDINTARIGYIEMGGVDVYQPDGVNLFTIGLSLGAAGESSELVINGGQFAASTQGSGLVRLFDASDQNLGVLASGVSTDGQSFTLALDDTTLTRMSESRNVAIEFVVDGETEVNLVESPPTATLNIVFNNTDIVMGDDTVTGLTDQELRQIFQDGTVCWAFNVPYATVQDRFNIRITNESAVAGSMTVTLYEASGSEVVSAELVNVQDENGNNVLSVLKSEADMGTGTGTVQNLLPAGQTLFLNSEILEAALGTSWTGRAVLRIVSELPELEMLAMLRNQLMDDASQPLNNLSLGAQGISCTQGQ